MSAAVSPPVRLGRLLLAEALGTALLLAVVVGSGVMAERLFPGQNGLALLVNALATGAGLYALMVSLGPVSGAHLNPVVSLWAAMRGQLSWRHASGYALAQGVGAVAGVLATHAMFDLPLLQHATQPRTGMTQWFSEAVATFGLLWMILSTQQHSPQRTPAAVALYIVSAYWFTDSTSFANPAVTLARSLTDSFAGIALGDVGGFVLAQVVGGLWAVVVAKGLLGDGHAPQPPSPAAAGAAGNRPRTAHPDASAPAGSAP